MFTHAHALKGHELHGIDMLRCQPYLPNFSKKKSGPPVIDILKLFHDLAYLFHLLRIPATLPLLENHQGEVSGESATLYMISRLAYPNRLADNYGAEGDWGRDHTQLSRIFNSTLHFFFNRHAGKVNGNVSWYSSRYDLYNSVIQHV